MYYVLEVSKTTTAYGFKVANVQSIPSNAGLVTGPFPRAQAAERLIRLQSCGWTTKWETPPEPLIKCKGCGKTIEEPNREEEFLRQCNDCTAKEEEENP